MRTRRARRARLLRALLVLAGLVAAPAPGPGIAAPAPLVVSVGGPAEDPAYLPVYVALTLGTFEAEGVQATLRRAKHSTAAMDAVREQQAAVAVTTMDQAIRGAWARGTPVRVLVAHTRAPAAILLASAAARDKVTRVQDLRGRKVGIPGPGTTGHFLLAALLRAARLEPWQLDIQSLGSPTLVSRLRNGELAAAILDEPWASRALEAGAATALLDFRRPEEAARALGGPFYEVVSVVPSGEKAERPPDDVLAGFARALIRVQTWLAATAPEAVADRLPAGLVEDRARFVARLAALRATYAADGEATKDGLDATLRVLRGGSPWPVSLEVRAADVREPAFVSAARASLGPAPPAP